MHMTGQPRREFVALSLGVLGSMAGCIAANGGTPKSSPATVTPDLGPETPDASTETPAPPPSNPETAHLPFNHAELLYRVDARFAQRDVASYYLAVVTSADHAAAFPTDRFKTEAASAFVTDTDYSQAAVVILQDRQSSSHPDLELRCTDIEGDTITVDAAYPGSARTADITTDTLLVRVATDESDVRAARATARSQYSDPVRISTRNVYAGAPTFDPAGDLVVRNRDCLTTSVSATVTYDGDLFFRDGLDLSPASLRRVDGLFSHAGKWTVAVRTDGETVERPWSLTGEMPGDVLVDVTGDGTVSLSHHATGVDATDPSACETNNHPYESSDSAKNLDHPVDLWILDHSGGEHHLTVTIRDGDTEVFSGEFDTQSGYDKARRAGLLAKKTIYTVDVTMDEMPTVSTAIPVREDVTKLEVRINESGELTVSGR